MSGAQFTPGPWIADEFCEEGDRSTRVGTYDGTKLYYHRTATIALCQFNDDEPERPDGVPVIGVVAAEANARLVAAAPDLHEAAADALAGWRYIRQFHGDLPGVGWDRVEQALTAALAKVRGKA